MGLLKKLSKLPPYIDYEGITFRLVLSHAGGRGYQLFYEIYDVDKSSIHYNEIKESGFWSSPFSGGGRKSFLWGEQYNNTDKDLRETINNGVKWLKQNGLYPNDL